MKTSCQICKHRSLVEKDLNGNPFCDLYEAFMYGHDEDCEKWEAAIEQTGFFYYYLNATPKEGIWLFTQQFPEPGDDFDYMKFNDVISFGDGEYGVYIKTYHTSAGMAFLKAWNIITHHIKNQNNWRRDFGQI